MPVQEEVLLGGRPGARASLENIIYDYFLARFGARQAAEMHLVAFLKAVQRYKLQHPKIRMFARLIGFDDSFGPLPPSSVEFYIALLNRVHARAGPLVGEVLEGQSHVKSRVRV